MTFGLDHYFKKQKETKKNKEQKDEMKEVEVLEINSSGPIDWQQILEETVKSMVLYPHLLDYTRTNILPKHPKITPQELSIQLRVPLGVAIVLLDKLRSED